MSFSVSRPLPLSAMPAVVLLSPDEAHEIDAVRAIFRDYANSLGIDLDFQDFEANWPACRANTPNRAARCCLRWSIRST